MKVHYNQNDNTLMVELLRKKVDHAYETETMIVHVSEDNEPVLLEIFDADAFLTEEAKTLPEEIKQRYFA
ncbi:MAG: hypothetical protein Q8L37_05550 [Candidatus Gottesmanbacteria bacterium]|nr:hypothetical protein [Candidatus Gottesmanbacteria bacterium]